MRAENISMLAYLRRAMGIWRRYPLALTAPMVVSSWVMLAASELAHHLGHGWRGAANFVGFVLGCLFSFMAHVFSSRVVSDLVDQSNPDWKDAATLCLRARTFRTGVGMFWRYLLWVVVAVAAGAFFEIFIRVIALMIHHPLVHGALTRPFIWITLLTFAACVAKYGFAIPFLAFSRGNVVGPISLSVVRTRLILRPLTWLTVCASASTLAVSEVFRGFHLHLALAAGWEIAWKMLLAAVQYVPYSWFAIAITLFAHQDWVAMRDGVSLTTVGADMGQAGLDG